MFGIIAASVAAAAAAQQYKSQQYKWRKVAKPSPVVTKCRCCGSSDYVIHNKVNICSYCRTPKEEQ